MRFTLALLIGMVFMSSTAVAGDVYINGQKLGAVADIELKGVSVRFDSEGNIHIDAPGYEVSAPGGDAQNTKRPEAVLQGTYCLVADTSEPGLVPFRFEVFLNGTKVGDLSSNQPTAMIPLTEFVQVGKNRVGIKAMHDPTRQIHPAKRKKSFRIRAGEGVMEGGMCNLSTTPVLYTRLARDTGDREDTFTFVAR